METPTVQCVDPPAPAEKGDAVPASAAPVASPEAAPGGRSAGGGTLPLDYENPWPEWVAASPLATTVFWLGVRRLITAGGAGLLLWGLTSLASGVNRHAAPVAAGWGAAFIVMTLPLRFGRPPRRGGVKRRRGRGRVSVPPGSGI
jgi:hypothetical protein